jgi:hypothetical protein
MKQLVMMRLFGAISKRGARDLLNTDLAIYRIRWEENYRP